MKLNLPSPDKELLTKRHKLVHTGDLPSGMDPVRYYNEITNFVTTVLLKMLGYSGKIFTLEGVERNI